MFFSCFLLHLHSYDNIVQTDAAKMFENTAVCMPGQEVVLYCVLQVNIAMLKVYTNSKVCVSSPPQHCLREIVQTQRDKGLMFSATTKTCCHVNNHKRVNEV